jgi:hypothetical protein
MAEVCIATVANTLTAGTHILSNVLLAACIVVGISLIAMGGVYLKAHRYNPKLVPLSKPFMYWALALCLFAIPLLEKYVGITGRSASKQIQQTQSVQCPDIDAPIQ